MDIDFIVAMSKATLDPLNHFTNDFSNIGAIDIPDVNLRNTLPGNVEVTIPGPQGFMPTSSRKASKDETMAFLLRGLSFKVLNGFMELNRYMEKHSKEEVTVDGLKDILTENIALIRAMHDPGALAIADSLQKAVNYPGESETKLIQKLTRENTEKFALLKDYIKSEQMETLRLKTEMDTILRTGIMDKETTPILLSIGGENIKARSIVTTGSFGDDLKKQALATNARILPSMESIRNGTRDPEIEEIQSL